MSDDFYDLFKKPQRPEPSTVTPLDPERAERATRYAAKALTSECENVASAPEGTRNAALNTAAFSIGQLVAAGHLAHDDTWHALREAALSNGLEDREINATLRSGLSAGERLPRAVLVDGTETEALGGDPQLRRVVLTSAAGIKPRPVFWLWKGRLAIGTIGLLAGREGLGKSTLAYWLAAQLTRGDLFGHFQGTPKSVLVCATEDSWEHTIVPRLMAAGADLERVYRVDVLNYADIHVGLSLPRDLAQTERHATEADAALLLLDPLMSRLGDLDTHRDSEVRQALEPLAALADRTRMAVLGLIHHNKSGSSDPLQLVMGSKAFTAVARSVSTVIPDPDDETGQRRLFGTPKNNLGTGDLPTLTFTIESHAIDTDEGTAWTGRLVFGEELNDSIDEAMRRATDDPDERSAGSEAGRWLSDYLESQGGTAASADIKRAAAKAGHSTNALHRARKRIQVEISEDGFPRHTFWSLPAAVVSRQSSQSSRGEETTRTTRTTAGQGQMSETSVVPVVPVVPCLQGVGTTDDPADLFGSTEDAS
jgi:hypothetical protein